VDHDTDDDMRASAGVSEWRAPRRAKIMSHIDDDDDDEAPQTVESLETKLAEYRASLNEVNAGLAATPDDEELVELKASLEEVIGITEDVLESVREVEAGTVEIEDSRDVFVDVAATTASLQKTFVGKDVLALPEGEGATWRRGRCVRVAQDGTLDVYLTESHMRVGVPASRVKLDIAPAVRGPEPVAVMREVYRGVPEPKRLELTRKTEYTAAAPPKKLQILPTDDAETREKKKKKLKSFKYKQRQQEISAEQNAKASSWQNFQAKGKRKGMVKSSIFSKKPALDD
jgi:survival of motor neuron-related-splicing factor 30